MDHYYLKIKIPKERMWPKVIFFGVCGASIGVLAGISNSDSYIYNFIFFYKNLFLIFKGG